MNPYKIHPGFGNRVSYAANALKRLAEGNGWTTDRNNGVRDHPSQGRKMDNCFEMWDGDAVVWQLMHRAQTDPVLMRGIVMSPKGKRAKHTGIITKKAATRTALRRRAKFTGQ
jgi:hypothetical protein